MFHLYSEFTTCSCSQVGYISLPLVITAGYFKSTFRSMLALFPAGVAVRSSGYSLCCSSPCTNASTSTSTQTKCCPSSLQLPICTHVQHIHITLLHKLCFTLLIWLHKLRLVYSKFETYYHYFLNHK